MTLYIGYNEIGAKGVNGLGQGINNPEASFGVF
jgi:hypothetical protein